MIKKISSLLLVFILLVCFITGCETKKDNTDNNDKKDTIKSLSDLSSNNGQLHCTRNATVEGGSGDFNYYVDYNGDDITYISSIDSVTISDSAKRKEYEDAYLKLDDYYKDIDYYYSKVDVSGDTVTHTVKINYEKIDVSKLIEIEGEEDNIYENNKAKLSKYFDLAKKNGVACSESTS